MGLVPYEGRIEERNQIVKKAMALGLSDLEKAYQTAYFDTNNSNREPPSPLPNTPSPKRGANKMPSAR
jgi:hypothetical protein